jgi:quercetin dioxygenase-like cupin family protein
MRTAGIWGALAVVAVIGGAIALDSGRPDPAPAEVLASHRLPALDGSRLGVTVMRVRYGPGESSEAHTHGCPVVGYVQYGRVRMQLEGEAPAVYEAGESFYEEAGRLHLISANASREQPAEFLAWFTCEGDAPIALAPAVSR